MTDFTTTDCSSGLHEYCTNCGCKCHDRKEGESQRDWLKRNMSMHHWMQTDYYRNKLDDHPTTNI